MFENESTPAPVLLMMSGDGDRGFATNSWRSRVDVKKHARYGYADSGYYQGYYRKYNVN